MTLLGVNVFNTTNNTGTITDFDGSYVLSVKKVINFVFHIMI